jgi:hypothetical protein
LKDGVKFAPGRGSLGEVVPESLARLFAHAATAFDEFATVSWSGTSGRSLEWRVCRPPLPSTDAASGSEPSEDQLAYLGPRKRSDGSS